MKITLHDPPEGFEAEAEWRAANIGESFMGVSEYDVHKCTVAIAFKRIVLTPKQKKYWRLDPVARFESASISPADSAVHLGFWDDGDLGYWTRSTPEVTQWLKVTECEE